MLSRNKSAASAATKKKRAPPRPPQPSPSKIQTSISFTSGSELQNRIAGQRSKSLVGRSDDLIDFNAPEVPIAKLQGNPNDPPDYRYRVGASVFFIKSPLVNSVSHSSKRAEQPFSPPRPSAEAVSKSFSPMLMVTSKSKQNETVTKYYSRPTIIKPGLSVDESSNVKQQQESKVTSTTANYGQSSSTYSNIPLTWDEPPHPTRLPENKPHLLPKPAPPPKKPGLGTARLQPVHSNIQSSAPLSHINEVSSSHPYYDEPPNIDEEDDDDDDDDEFLTPMPSDPPPPLPETDYGAGDEWGHQATDWANEKHARPESNLSNTTGNRMTLHEVDRPYAIALYDYYSESQGDLAFQAGDLVYLVSKIDDNWLEGTCGDWREGSQGIFPSNYVSVVVPLPEPDEYSNAQNNGQGAGQEQQFVSIYANIDYDFTKETDSDLSLQTGKVVKILGRINEDWLYGEIDELRGQFPASFVSPVPLDLPTLTF